MVKRTPKSIFMLLIMMIFFLSSCGSTGQVSDLPDNDTPTHVEPSEPPHDNSEIGNITDSVENIKSNGSAQTLFTTKYVPVVCSDDRFIVRNEGGNLYGLIDKDGTPIMPCKYEEIQFQQTKSKPVLKVMSKGSYGVFDLDGIELLPCEYTDIRFSSCADACIVKTFLEKEGLLDLTGVTILPIEFDKIAFGYGKIIAAGKAADEQGTGNIVAYSPDGKVIKEFPWEKGIADIVVGNGGNLLSVNYWTGSNRMDLEYLAADGDAIWGDTEVLGNLIFYFQGSTLLVRNVNTQEERMVWDFPEGEDINRSDIRTVYSNIDPITGVESIDLFVVGFTDDRPQGKGYDLRVTLGEQIDVINYDTLDIMSATLSRRANLGEFCNGIAIAVPQNGYLYTINTKGEKLGEIQEPYTDCILLVR